MLQIQYIKKEYRTGSLVQKALDDVSLNLRDNGGRRVVEGEIPLDTPIMR